MPQVIHHKELSDDDDIDIPDEDFYDDIIAKKKVEYDETTETGSQLLSNVQYFPFYQREFYFHHVNILKFAALLQEHGENEMLVPEFVETMKPHVDLSNQLKDENQPLYQLLMSLPECRFGTLKIRSVVVLALLWCHGSLREKADALFQLVNPPKKEQTIIHPVNDNWSKVFDLLVFTATVWTYQ